LKYSLPKGCSDRKYFNRRNGKYLSDENNVILNGCEKFDKMTGMGSVKLYVDVIKAGYRNKSKSAVSLSIKEWQIYQNIRYGFSSTDSL
jgi:hypothetical protein